MLFFLIGSYLLGLAYIVLFFLISLLVYLFAWFCSLFGIFVDISGSRMLQVIFVIICGLSYYVYDVSCFAFALFFFISAVFMLGRTAELWCIGSS